MPQKAKVFVHHGPYDRCGVVEHRTHRLDGLSTTLETAGHQVEYVQIRDRNLVELWVNGENVFSCDIRDLDYGGDGQLDDLCHTAKGKVATAF